MIPFSQATPVETIAVAPMQHLSPALELGILTSRDGLDSLSGTSFIAQAPLTSPALKATPAPRIAQSFPKTSVSAFQKEEATE